MPPNRVRPTEDSRSESSVATAKQPSTSVQQKSAKGKKTDYGGTMPSAGGSNLKEITSAADGAASGANAAENAHGGVDWLTMPVSVLNEYRHSNRLSTPTSFSDYAHQARLTHPRGVGAYSPTMARPRARRRVPREQLAMAVRKEFNASAVNETEVVTNFLYKVKNQNKNFRMRFKPGEGHPSKRAG